MSGTDSAKGTSHATYLPRYDRQPGRRFLVTERDIEIMQAINRYRYLRTGQIQRLVFPDNTSLQSTRRRLRFLFHDGYIARMVPFTRPGHGGEEVAYHLDKKGEQALRDLEVDVLRPSKTGQVRPTFLLHALELSDFRVNLELALQDRPELSLSRFVADFELKSHIQGRKRREHYRLFDEVQHPTSKRSYVVYPDGLIVLTARKNGHEKRALFFLEIDRGTEGLRVIRDKFIGYRLYQEQGRFKKFGKFARFRLLLQTTSAKRAANMAAALHDYQGADMVLITTRDQVAESTVLSKPIWRDTAGQAHALLKGQSC